MNQPAKVLVVEDDATLRQALCDTIKFGGYEAVEAISGCLLYTSDAADE